MMTFCLGPNVSRQLLVRKPWSEPTFPNCKFDHTHQVIFKNACLHEWRHQMETFSALLVLCAGNSPVNGEFPSQRPVTRSFGVFFDLRLNSRLSKHREAGDLRRHRTHYDVIVLNIYLVCNGYPFLSIPQNVIGNRRLYFSYDHLQKKYGIETNECPATAK